MFKDKNIMIKKVVPIEIRNLAIEDYLTGMSYRMVAEKYSVDHKTVRRWAIKSGKKIRTREEAYILESIRIKGVRRSPNSEFKKGNYSWNTGTKGVMKANVTSFKKGEHPSPKTEFKRGKDNPYYIDGRGEEIYPYKFNKKLKDKIRKRDGYICQNCNISEDEHVVLYGKKLHIHHINYNREDCLDSNLITWCIRCNLKANYTRDCWEDYYKNKIRGIKYVYR